MFMLICSTNRLVADGGPGTVKCKHNPHYSEKHENSILNVGDLTLTIKYTYVLSAYDIDSDLCFGYDTSARSFFSHAGEAACSCAWRWENFASRFFSPCFKILLARYARYTTGLGHNKPDYSCPTWQKLLVPFCIIQCKGWEIDEHMVGKYSRIIPDLNFVIE